MYYHSGPNIYFNKIKDYFIYLGIGCDAQSVVLGGYSSLYAWETFCGAGNLNRGLWDVKQESSLLYSFCGPQRER